MEPTPTARTWLAVAVIGAASALPAACSGHGGEAAAPLAGAPPPESGGVSAEPTVAAPEQIFVLGDSLSDTGNAAALADWLLGQPFHPQHVIGFCNPADIHIYARSCDDLFFRRSRVSDGAVAAERLAQHFELALQPSFHIVPERPVIGTNYAVAGGKAAGAGIADLAHQVDRLVLDHGPALPGDALYLVMIGGNDAIDALQIAAEPPDAASVGPDAVVAAAVDAIGMNVERLIAFGARRLIVANVPDLAALPVVRLRALNAASPRAVLAAAAAVSQQLNAALDARLERLARDFPDARLGAFDLHAAVDQAMAAASVIGRNATDACFDSERYRTLATAERLFHPGCAPEAGGSPRFDSFFFWDGLHPTGAAHAAIGQALIESALRGS